MTRKKFFRDALKYATGAAAAVSLVRDAKASTPVIDELMGWYTQTLFPSDESNVHSERREFGLKNNIAAITRSKSGSPLCHVSVTNWCTAAGYAISSPEQRERCARVAGDTAAKAVILLNAREDGKLRLQYPQQKSTAACLSCHGPEKEVGNADTKMTCGQCHGDPHE